MNELSNKTLSEIVTEHYQAAPVFEKYGLDFCCKGKRPLTDACTDKNIPIGNILKELDSAIAIDDLSFNFNQMSLTELCEYIVRVHHGFVKQNLPQIAAYIDRVATKHGDRYPYMLTVKELFAELSEEFKQHMFKEEKILFPRIKLLELNAAGDYHISYLQSPIDAMEHEHDHAGEIMEKIRGLTNNYTAPEQACTTFRMTLESLKGFEKDLHQHVHLENNILFPGALQLAHDKDQCSSLG